MREKMKRFTAAILAMVTMISTFFSNGVPVLAASESANIAFWVASARDHGPVSEFQNKTYTGGILYAMIDGHSAYCMNFSLSAKGGQLMTSDEENTRTPLSQAQRKQLAYCMYYGYSSTENTGPVGSQADEYIATQAMVWIITEGLFGTPEADSAASKICYCAPNSDASYQYYETLRNNINKSYNAVRPSFASVSKNSGESYVLKWSESNKRYEYTFKDTNGVLKDFDFSISGYTVEKNGNTMTVYTTKTNSSDTVGSFTSTAGVVEPTTSSVFWLTGDADDQEFVSEQPQADPVSAYIKVKTEEMGYGDLVKTDASTGKKVKGAVYGIYSDSACKNKVDSMTTDENGYAKSKSLTAGTYYVKEISVPKPYIIDSKVYTLAVTAGKTTRLNVSDKEQMGKLTIYKEGEVLTKWNGTNFVYEKKKLSNAVFKVTAAEAIYKADGTKVYNKGDLVASNLKSNGEAGVTVNNLYLGSYEVTETSAPSGFTNNSNTKTVNITYAGETVTVVSKEITVTNTRQKASIEVNKKDSATKNGVAGAKYTLYANSDIKDYKGNVIVKKDTALETVTTAAGGKAKFTVDIPVGGKFIIKETKAPTGYVKNTKDSYSFSFTAMESSKAKASFSYDFYNDRVNAVISIEKVDKETKKAVPQGDATLKGAVYGLYAKEDIVHPDGVTGVLYKKGSLVAKLTTDKDGKAEVKNLYLGKYYVKEIEPSKGYVLDETSYDVICDYEGETIPQVLRNATVYEEVIKQPFQLIKISTDGSETEGDLLKGAGFSAYLKSSLKVNKDGSYDFENSKPVVITEDGKKTMYTDKNGYACSVALPYGTYVVVESVTPHNMKTINPFEVTVSKNKPSEPQVWRVFLDKEFNAKLRIVKLDAETKLPVLRAGATFKIYNLDTKKYVSMITTYPSKVTHTTFTTDDDGDLILPGTLKVGNYRIEEIDGPKLYVVNKNYVDVKIDTDTFYQVDPDTYEAIITIEYEDESTKGELTVIKQGELLDNYEGSLMEDGKGSFVYKTGNLAGAKFDVYANEDIYTPDNQKDLNGNRIKIYSKGEKVATLVTDKSGKAVLKDLPIGAYKIIEVEAPYGFVLNEKEQIVSFRYVDDKTPVVKESATFTDDRQKISMSVVKKDSKNNEPISGAVFGLYAKEDIKNLKGNIVVKEGSLLETATSDETGLVQFVKDYPFAKYEIKELVVPDGYVSNNETIGFDTEYQGQDKKTVYYAKDYLNDETSFEFSKIDITSGAELSGATLTVIDMDGNVVDTWVSKAGEKHVINKLVVGKSYKLREEFAPYGYLKASDVEFTVIDTKEIQSVVMKDEVPTGSIVINKDGEFLSSQTLVKGYLFRYMFNYKKDMLAGVTFDVYANEDIVSPDGLDTVMYHAGELVGTIETDRMGIAKMDGLPLGHYYLVETKTIEGFVLDSTPIDAELSYVDQDTRVVYAGMDVTNERQKVMVTVIKKDAEDNKPLADATFGLYAKEDILNKDGEVVIAADSLIEKAITSEDGAARFVSDLPLGIYYIKEITAPKGYSTSEDIIELDASYKGEDIPVVELSAEFKDYPTQFEFSKVDITNDEEIDGATLTVLDGKGNVIDTWKSKAGKKHMLKYLEVGKTYTLREEIAPDGYVRATDIKFVVKDTKKIQSVVMKDDFTKVEISKTDITGEVEIGGAKLCVINSKGKVVESWTSKKGESHKIEKLPVGKYILREETAPYGYKIAKDVEFEVKETGEVQKVEMKDEYAVGKIIINKTDSDSKKPIAGVEFEIRDKDGNVIEKLVTDKNGHAESKELPICEFNEDGSFKEDIHYYVVETKAADGYVLDSTEHDVVLQYDDNAPECVVYTLDVTNKPTEPDLPQTGDTANPYMWFAIGMVSLAGAVITMFGKKRKRKEQ